MCFLEGIASKIHHLRIPGNAHPKCKKSLCSILLPFCRDSFAVRPVHLRRGMDCLISRRSKLSGMLINKYSRPTAVGRGIHAYPTPTSNKKTFRSYLLLQRAGFPAWKLNGLPISRPEADSPTQGTMPCTCGWYVMMAEHPGEQDQRHSVTCYQICRIRCLVQVLPGVIQLVTVGCPESTASRPRLEDRMMTSFSKWSSATRQQRVAQVFQNHLAAVGD